MKKLMIAAAIVCAAVAANAASYDWGTSTFGKIYSPGTTTTLASGTAYIFDSASVSQLAILQNFYDNGTLSTGSLNSKTVTNGAIAMTKGEAFTWGKATETLNAYIALIDGKNIYIGSIVSGTGKDVGYTQLSFNEKTASQAAATTLTKSPEAFGGAGWYTKGTEPEPTPEPTSAILMALGLAGLALRRKQK